MCKKRTSLAGACWLGAFAVWLASCGGEEAKNCDQVTGLYYIELELLDALAGLPDPSACLDLPIETLDLTEDNRTLNTGTSSLNTRVGRFGCDVQVTYTVMVTNPGDPEDMSGWVFDNNWGIGGGTKYAVENDAVLTGEAIYYRLDRNGDEVCRSLFRATLYPEDVWLERQTQ